MGEGETCRKSQQKSQQSDQEKRQQSDQQKRQHRECLCGILSFSSLNITRWTVLIIGVNISSLEIRSEILPLNFCDTIRPQLVTVELATLPLLAPDVPSPMAKVT